MKKGRLAQVIFTASPKTIERLNLEGYTIIHNLSDNEYEAYVTDSVQFLKILHNG